MNAERRLRPLAERDGLCRTSGFRAATYRERLPTANERNQAILAFLWKDGVMQNLGALNGDPCSVADAVNSKGQVVGGSGFFDAAFFPACTTTVEHAFLWDNGTMVDLNVFLPPNSDLTLNEAVFINSRGEISGFGTLLTARNTLS